MCAGKGVVGSAKDRWESSLRSPVLASVWISALMANDSVDEKVCVAALSLSEADRFESAGLKQSWNVLDDPHCYWQREGYLHK